MLVEPQRVQVHLGAVAMPHHQPLRPLVQRQPEAQVRQQPQHLVQLVQWHRQVEVAVLARLFAQ